MYAGYNGTLGSGAEQYDELWILTIFAFKWILASVRHTASRIGHTCHVVGGRQVLTIGGVNPSYGDVWSAPDYNNIQGLGTFDLSALTWQEAYVSDVPPYERSKPVQNVYSAG